MADADTKTNGDYLDTKFGDEMKEAVEHFVSVSKVKSNGIREVPKDAYVKALKKRGVTEEEVKRVQEAVQYQNSVAGYVALADLETKIGEASDEQRADPEYRRELKATVRLPTFGGSSQITVHGERVSNTPTRMGEEPAEKTISYGRMSTTINTKSHLLKSLHEEANARIKKAFGI